MAASQPANFNLQEFTDAGMLLVGGRLYTYAYGTTAQKTAYIDPDGTVPHTYTSDGAGGQYIALNARGELPAPLYLVDGSYDLSLRRADGSTVWTRKADGVENSNRSLVAQLALSSGSSMVGFIQSGAAAVKRWVQDRFLDLPHATDFNGVSADGTTDSTSAILTAAAEVGGAMLIPPGVKFDRNALISSMPTDVVALDLSVINDFNSAGETTKHIGIMSSDVAASDTHWAVSSGHHAITTLNNFGTAGSSSAAERKASVLWAVGQYQKGSADKRGFRGAAILQFTKESSSSYWIYQLRSLAPWTSIAGAYESWAAGEVILGAGVYRVNNSQHYVSAGAGTTGATPPTHTSGTVSDGGVNWTWIDSGDRSVFNVREDGRWLIGLGDYSATWRHKVSSVDPGGTYSGECESTGISKYAQTKLIPTDAGGVVSPQPFLRAENGIGLRVMKSDGSTDLARFSDSGGFAVKEFVSLSATVSDNNATPSVAGIGTLYISNTAPTTITGLTGGVDDQVVRLVFTNTNTSIASSATLLMTGSVNVTPSTYSSITMKKVPASISDRWIEDSRSIK
jgi:hypothetical protein